MSNRIANRIFSMKKVDTAHTGLHKSKTRSRGAWWKTSFRVARWLESREKSSRQLLRWAYFSFLPECIWAKKELIVARSSRVYDVIWNLVKIVFICRCRSIFSLPTMMDETEKKNHRKRMRLAKNTAWNKKLSLASSLHISCTKKFHPRSIFQAQQIFFRIFQSISLETQGNAETPNFAGPSV